MPVNTRHTMYSRVEKKQKALSLPDVKKTPTHLVENSLTRLTGRPLQLFEDIGIYGKSVDLPGTKKEWCLA